MVWDKKSQKGNADENVFFSFLFFLLLSLLPIPSFFLGVFSIHYHSLVWDWFEKEREIIRRRGRDDDFDEEKDKCSIENFPSRILCLLLYLFFLFIAIDWPWHARRTMTESEENSKRKML